MWNMYLIILVILENIFTLRSEPIDTGVQNGRITLAPTNNFGIAGESVTIKCAIEGSGLSWQYMKRLGFVPYGTKTRDPGVRRHIVADNVTGQFDLVINSVQPRDSGLFICQDRKLHSKAMHLAVITKGPAAYVAHTSGSTSVTVGSTVRTTCSAIYSSRDMDLEISATDGNLIKSVIIKTPNTYEPITAELNITQIAEYPSVPAVNCSFKFLISDNADRDPNIDESATPSVTKSTTTLSVSAQTTRPVHKTTIPAKITGPFPKTRDPGSTELFRRTTDAPRTTI